MPLTGVTGWPVGHSRSPALHAAAFEALGLSGWASQLLPIPPEVFEETVRALPASGFVGINVTIPHKEAALAIADDATPEAMQIGAANTLSFAEGEIFAANTDAPAIQQAAVASLGVSDLDGLIVGVMGAGGSARAAAFAATQAGAKAVKVWNRNPERASRLADSMPSVEAVVGLDDADVLINATPVGLLDGATTDGLPISGLATGRCQLLIDLVYAAAPTELLELAHGQGVSTVDGLEILVRQGALSIEIWTGQRPDLGPLQRAVHVA